RIRFQRSRANRVDFPYHRLHSHGLPVGGMDAQGEVPADRDLGGKGLPAHRRRMAPNPDVPSHHHKAGRPSRSAVCIGDLGMDRSGMKASRRAPAGTAVPKAESRRPDPQPKVALVTGSAKRLGRELIVRLADGGCFAWVHYLTSRKEAEEVLAEIESRGGRGALIKGDMASKRDIRSMAEKVKARSGRLDVLVNNVGIYRPGSLVGYPV